MTNVGKSEVKRRRVEEETSKSQATDEKVLQYYRDYSGDIDSLVPEVHLPNISFTWPATCPRDDAQALMVEGWRRGFGTGYSTRNYTYIFENATSGRRFKVILGANCMRSIERGEGGQVIRDEVRIYLSRATLRVL